MAGFDTLKSRVAVPTVAGPRASRSTMPRRIGWASAPNESLTITLTIARPASRTEPSSTSSTAWRVPDQPRPQGAGRRESHPGLAADDLLQRPGVAVGV